MLEIRSDPTDRRLSAAQFALSHACCLIARPLAGWTMTRVRAVPALLVLALLAAAGIVARLRLRPADEPGAVPHEHPDLPPEHPHSEGHRRHAHPLVADDLHPRWGMGA